MEDPVQFDVWAQIMGSRPRGAHLWLMERRPELSEHQARRALAAAAYANERLPIATALGWGQAKHVLQTLPDWLGLAVVVQEGCSPTGASSYCAEHRLSHGGCLGCPICGGFNRL